MLYSQSTHSPTRYNRLCDGVSNYWMLESAIISQRDSDESEPLGRVDTSAIRKLRGVVSSLFAAFIERPKSADNAEVVFLSARERELEQRHLFLAVWLHRNSLLHNGHLICYLFPSETTRTLPPITSP